MKYVCNDCSKEYPVNTFDYKCECGGLFNLDYDKEGNLDFQHIRSSIDRSLWRFSASLPPLSKNAIDRVTMGEGGTPLISLGEKLKGKGDYFMPTLSFKDRGAVVLVAMMAQYGIKRCALDSSGNAGTAIAAYCARADIECDVFVPAHTSDKKVAQIVAHGAKVHLIEGSREDTATATKEFINREKVFYASHIFNPFFYEGTKTYLYELFEQYNYSLPEMIVVPVGNGTLFLGAIIALDEMVANHLIERIPLLVAVQAKNCAPIAHAFTHQLSHIEEIKSSSTVAEGIASAQPARGDQILANIRRTNSIVVSVDEEQILSSQESLAKMGVYVELTSAANYAGYLQSIKEDEERASLTAVIPLCGAGLKSLH
jgi:threonine synthase